MTLDTPPRTFPSSSRSILVGVLGYGFTSSQAPPNVACPSVPYSVRPFRKPELGLTIVLAAEIMAETEGSMPSAPTQLGPQKIRKMVGSLRAPGLLPLASGV